MDANQGKAYTGHVQMTVESAKNMHDRALVDMFGGPASEVREELARLEGIGRKYLLTEGCDNYDETTGKCLKHYEN